jgi:hypothetical protein
VTFRQLLQHANVKVHAVVADQALRAEGCQICSVDAGCAVKDGSDTSAHALSLLRIAVGDVCITSHMFNRPPAPALH